MGGNFLGGNFPGGEFDSPGGSFIMKWKGSLKAEKLSFERNGRTRIRNKKLSQIMGAVILKRMINSHRMVSHKVHKRIIQS